jgi:NDP-sugar pyrophosphorylase family protein
VIFTDFFDLCELFDLNHTIAADFLRNARSFGDILPKIGEFIEAAAQNLKEDYTEIKRGVFVAKDAKIASFAHIEAPAIIGVGAEIRHGAFIRGNVIIGENCVIGNSTELKNCIILDKAQVPHYNYVGDSILGFHAHMGAGAVCSNLKADGKNVVIKGDRAYETNLRKVGGFLGDFADIGCGCVLNPGTVVGKNTSVYPLNALRGVFPEGCIVKSMDNIVKRR